MADETVPAADRPTMFGGHLEPVLLPWAWAEHRLTVARNYWIATTRLDDRPHTRPVWGVWLDRAFFFSTGSLAAGHLAGRPEITVHLESGSEVVIIEGRARVVDERALIVRIVDAYNPKYEWDVDPDNLPGPFYEVRPRVAFGWTSDDSGLDGGAGFHGTATRWRF
jgi:Pyridoxamine 5'-phosphate oxidase